MPATSRKVKKKKKEEEIKEPKLSATEEANKARAEEKGLKYVPEAEARARTSQNEGVTGNIIEKGGKTYLAPKVAPEELANVQQKITGQTETEGRTSLAEQTALQKNLSVAEETGVFEQRPERVELSPSEQEINQLRYHEQPIKQAKQFVESIGKDWEEYKKELNINDEGLSDLIQNPETQRQLIIQEIQRKELNASLTASQKLGAVLEPFLGNLKVLDVDVGGYVDRWVRMPSKEVDTIVESIAELESSVSGMTDSASQGEIGNPQEVLRDIAKREEELAIYEARIKKLIMASDTLRANPEDVNLIEGKILSARETIFEAKQRAAEGALITPTDSNLYIKLQQLRNEKGGAE